MGPVMRIMAVILAVTALVVIPVLAIIGAR